MWEFENSCRVDGFTLVAGVDEAGRGPLAGPVVSGAVILPYDFICPGITDSKKLTPAKRDHYYDIIMTHALAASYAEASVEEIDTLNILQASLLSMKRAVEKLAVSPDCLLIDGKFTIDSPINQLAIIKGDSKSISIAAASIVAKVARDRIMEDAHALYPAYGFKKHKGYPTKVHKEAIEKIGPSPIHRKTFKGVKEFLSVKYEK
ncbi:ribonuclease HII [Desulfamplus magnetovallimortis]|nr:ribonuclease HII [Desulfamplus magnetovallimortis]